jgi:predicted ester cyclase
MSPLEHAKRLVTDLARRLRGAPDEAAVAAVLAEACHADAVWSCAQPLNDLRGPGDVAELLLLPLRRAMPDVERRDDILIAGRFADRDWVTVTGHYVGTFERDLFGVPPTGGAAFLRFGAFHEVRDGRIGQTYLLLDLMDLARQAGVWVWPPSTGVDCLVPGPATGDGVRLGEGDPARGAETLALVDAMLAGLGRYAGDLDSLASMGQDRFWHPDMMWYGPAGIGTTRGLRGFQDFHQRPFLRALPDRKGGDHKARFAQDDYACSTGWPSLRATLAGPNWLGLPPTGRRIEMRVMDWWRREGGLLRENWVLIDLLDVQVQCGLDPFDRLAFEAKRRAA